MFSKGMSIFSRGTKCFVYGASVQGLSHKKSQIECQDYYGFKQIKSKSGKKYVVAGVADGVGTCKYSSFGSKAAIDAVLRCIEELLIDDTCDHWNSAEMINILKKSFDEAYETVINTADQHSFSPLTLATTLSLIIYDGEYGCIGHIGDSGIISLFKDGSYKLVTKRDRDSESEIVSNILSPKELWHFISIDQPIAAIFLMTDGLLDTYCKDDHICWNSIKEYLVDRRLIRRSEDVSLELKKFLSSDEMTSCVNDDMTLIVVQNISEDLPTVVQDEACAISERPTVVVSNKDASEDNSEISMNEKATIK